MTNFRRIIVERAINVGIYLVDNNATVRQTAIVCKVSKSTVHKDITERLSKINPVLCREAKKVLEHNKEERHIRGGIATKRKYEKMRG